MLDTEICECGIVHTLSSSENLSGNSPNFSGDTVLIILVRCQRKSPTIKHFDHAVEQVFTIHHLYLINTEDLRGNINALFGSSQMFE